MSKKLKRRIRSMYFEDGLLPLTIWKITGVHPDDVRVICYGRKA